MNIDLRLLRHYIEQKERELVFFSCHGEATSRERKSSLANECLLPPTPEEKNEQRKPSEAKKSSRQQ